MSTTDPHLLSGAYALDALDDAERAEFEAHLTGCEDCSAEVAELRETATRLAVLSEQEPPESLRAKVLAGISSTRQLPPEHGGSGVAELAVARSKRADRARRLTMPVAAALLGILSLAIGAWGIGQHEQVNQLHAQADLVASVLAAPDATTASGQIGTGRASLVVSEQTGQAVVVASGVAMPGDDRVYQLWRVDSAGNAAPDTTFVPSGDGSVAVNLDGPLEGAEAVAISVEPAGGSQEPTTTPIGSFPLV